MKEKLLEVRDLTYDQALEELQGAAVTAAEGIIFEAATAPERDYLTYVPLETVAMFSRYLEDSFETSQRVPEGGPLNPDAELMLHGDSIHRSIYQKLQNTLSLDMEDARHYIALNNREVEVLGDLIASELNQEEQACDGEVMPWDADEFAQESDRMLRFYDIFEKSGGTPNEEHVAYFQRFLSFPI